MQILFWLSVLLVIYVYVGYPLALHLLVRLRPLSNPPAVTDYQPDVVILIAAFNEEEVIRENIENKLAQNYPAEKIRLVVISDESEDGTDDIVKEFSERRVALLRQSPRQGKTSGLNLALDWLEEQGDESEIIVFADANSIYEDNTIAKLVENFRDPSIGYVTGKMVYVNADGSLVGDGCSAYMKYENSMRAKETLIGSVIGVDGGVDAMRKSLHTRLNADQLPDFVQPLRVVEQGFRIAYESEAILKEESLDESGREFKMRVRVGLRALWALHDMRKLMNPFKYGLFSWQLISHKLLRYLAFVPLLVIFITSLILCNDAAIYTLALVAQLGFYSLAWVAHRKQCLSTQGSETNEFAELSWYYSLPYYFTLLNIACAMATAKYLKGEKMVIWKPRLG